MSYRKQKYFVGLIQLIVALNEIVFRMIYSFEWGSSIVHYDKALAHYFREFSLISPDIWLGMYLKPSLNVFLKFRLSDWKMSYRYFYLNHFKAWFWLQRKVSSSGIALPTVHIRVVVESGSVAHRAHMTTFALYLNFSILRISVIS